LRELEIEELIVVPTYLNPFKSGFFAPPFKRLEWIKDMVKGMDKVKISSFEIDREAPTPSILTVEHFKDTINPSKIFFIIGADNLSSLHRWEGYDKLKEYVEFVVATRDGFGISGGYKILEIDVPISSTEIRNIPIPDMIPSKIAEDVVRFYKKN